MQFLLIPIDNRRVIQLGISRFCSVLWLQNFIQTLDLLDKLIFFMLRLLLKTSELLIF